MKRAYRELDPLDVRDEVEPRLDARVLAFVELAVRQKRRHADLGSNRDASPVLGKAS